MMLGKYLGLHNIFGWTDGEKVLFKLEIEMGMGPVNRSCEVPDLCRGCRRAKNLISNLMWLVRWLVCHVHVCTCIQQVDG